MWYSIINCSHCSVITSPGLVCFLLNWKSVLFDPPSPILLTPTVPISGRHQSYLCEFGGFFGCYLFLHFTYTLIHTIFVFFLVWCISFRIMPLRSIRAGPSMLQMARCPFLWLSNISSCMCVCVCVYIYVCDIFFIHFFADEHSGGFYILAIINKAAINMRMHMSSQVSVFVSFG